MARPRGPRPSLEAMRPLFEAGASFTEMAHALGMPEHTVRRAAKEAGLVRAQPQVARQAPEPAPAAASAPPAEAPAAPQEPGQRAERARQLLQDPRKVLEEMAELASDDRVPPSQRFRAQKTLADALLGKAKAGQPVVPGHGGERAPVRTFDPSVCTTEDARRYLEALQTQEEIESKYGFPGIDGSES